MRIGSGTFTYANGDKYEGEWHADKRLGTGRFTYANGDEYEGQWRDVSHDKPPDMRKRIHIESKKRPCSETESSDIQLSSRRPRTRYS